MTDVEIEILAEAAAVNDDMNTHLCSVGAMLDHFTVVFLAHDKFATTQVHAFNRTDAVFAFLALFPAIGFDDIAGISVTPDVDNIDGKWLRLPTLAEDACGVGAISWGRTP